MNKVFSKINIGDVVFLAILSVVLLLLSSLIMPIVMFTQIFALRQLFAAPVFAFFCTIGLRRVPKLGALSIIGFLTGGVLIFMSPIMFFNNVIAAIVTELIVLLVFKNYESRKSIITATTIYMPLTLPVTIVATMMFKGLDLSKILGSTLEIAILPPATLILGFLGAYFGMKVSDELKRAGKI